jgi:hypothetical protein
VRAFGEVRNGARKRAFGEGWGKDQVPMRGMAKFAVYMRCSRKGCTDPVMASGTNEAWWCE